MCTVYCFSLLYNKFHYTLIVIVISVVFIVNCSYRIHNIDCLNEKLKKYHNIKNMILHSYDPLGDLTKSIYIELCKNNIDVLDTKNNYSSKKNTYMYLYIIDASESHITNSVFSDGTEAEYQLVLHVRTKLIMPGKNDYPINIRVHRTFIRNTNNSLYNDIQENDIRILMYQEIAEQLILHIGLQFEKFLQ